MKHVLIVIDLIEDYFDALIWPRSVIPSRRKQLVEATNGLVAGCRASDVPVIWVRQEFGDDMSDAFPHARRAGMRYAVRGTPGSRMLAGLDVRATDDEVVKTRFSAFHGTSLSDLLAEIGAKVVILAGITTAWCVRSTAVDAYQRDFEVVLAVECMAAFDEESHRESIEALDGYIAEVLPTDEILRRVSVRRAGGSERG